MCGTGSNTLVAADATVPSHRVITAPDDLPGSLGRSPVVPLSSVGLLGPLLGIAEGMLATIADDVDRKAITYFSYPTRGDSEALLERLGLAAMRIESAWLHTRRALADLEAEATSGPMDYLASTRGQADAGYAVSCLREAADALMSIAGASAFADANRLQRAWRDLTVGSHHAILNTGASLELYGRALAGRPSNRPLWGPTAALLA